MTPKTADPRIELENIRQEVARLHCMAEQVADRMATAIYESDPDEDVVALQAIWMHCGNCLATKSARLRYLVDRELPSPDFSNMTPFRARPKR